MLICYTTSKLYGMKLDEGFNLYHSGCKDEFQPEGWLLLLM